jgi:protein-disulfide isomerase
MEHNHEHNNHDHHCNFIIRNGLATPIAIVIAGALIASAIFWGGRVSGNTATGADIAANAPAGAGAPSAQTADASKAKTAGVPFVGQANAKVTFAFWSDYQCPFCKRFQNDAIEQTISDYVNSGKVKILFKEQLSQEEQCGR